MDGAPSKRLLQRQPFWHSPYEEPDAGAGVVHTITVILIVIRNCVIAEMFLQRCHMAADGGLARILFMHHALNAPASTTRMKARNKDGASAIDTFYG